jgi:choice-of-anchor C domain-containing protein
MNTTRFMITLALSLVTANTGFAQNLLVNGSFEDGILSNPSFFDSLPAGNNHIVGWTIGENGVDYNGTYWQAADGSRSIDLDSSTALGAGPYNGSISQSFTTNPGGTYLVTFDLAGNPEGPPTIKNLTASAGSFSEEFSFDITGHSKTNMGYVEESFQFSADSTTTTLTFTSLAGTGYGSVIDNVSAVVVPESSSLLLAAFGLVAFANPFVRRVRAAK